MVSVLVAEWFLFSLLVEFDPRNGDPKWCHLFVVRPLRGYLKSPKPSAEGATVSMSHVFLRDHGESWKVVS